MWCFPQFSGLSLVLVLSASAPAWADVVVDSSEAITNSSANIVERCTYCSAPTQLNWDSYDYVAIADGPINPIPLNFWGTPHSAIGNSWMFTGRQYKETGIYYYCARYYDAAKGRFGE